MAISKRLRIVLLTFGVIVPIIWGCWFLFIRDSYKPLHKLTESNYPVFVDDGDITSLLEAGTHQLAFLDRKDPATVITFGEDEYPVSWLRQSVENLLVKLSQRPSTKELQQFIRQKYLVYQAGGRPSAKKRQMLVTGYYEPVFPGSLIRQPPYIFPIYGVPGNLIVRKGAAVEIGRQNERKEIVPYWSRKEIEDNNYLAGTELAYLRDPIDAYLLHIQGSGRIRLPDGTLRSVRFAGSNGLEYRSIGKLLVDEHIMPLEQVTMVTIRQYLNAHPEEIRRVLQHNPRFIFFNWGDGHGPKGSSGEYLTPGRSTAMDLTALPIGAVGFLQSRKPTIDTNNNLASWEPLSRFVFAQDSGAAIQGTGRLDIFWGNGSYAELAANLMKEPGKLYFLVQKGYISSNTP